MVHSPYINNKTVQRCFFNLKKGLNFSGVRKHLPTSVATPLYVTVVDPGRKFERHAVEVMNACYAKHADKARQLLELDLTQNWGSKNLLTLANTAEQMDFMETTCCQIVLTEYWYREIIFSSKSYRKILQVSLFFIIDTLFRILKAVSYCCIHNHMPTVSLLTPEHSLHSFWLPYLSSH